MQGYLFFNMATWEIEAKYGLNMHLTTIKVTRIEEENTREHDGKILQHIFWKTKDELCSGTLEIDKVEPWSWKTFGKLLSILEFQALKLLT
jgi:hypothetical protein